jgi:hypothetical protein
LNASIFVTVDNSEGKRLDEVVIKGHISVQNRDNAKFYAGLGEKFMYRKRSEQSCATFWNY